MLLFLLFLLSFLLLCISLLTNEIHFVSMKVSNAITDMLIKNFLKDCGIYWYFFVNPSFKYFYEMSKYLEIQKYTSMNPFLLWYLQILFVNPSLKHFYKMSKCLEIQKYTIMNPSELYLRCIHGSCFHLGCSWTCSPKTTNCLTHFRFLTFLARGS